MAQPATNPKIEELRFRLKTDPKSRLFYQLAEELRKSGQFAEAEQVLRSGLAVYPAYLAAWVSLGRVLREQKNDTGAVEALSKAMQLDPGNVVAARLLADAHLALGDKIEAIKKYKLVHALLPGDEELKNTIERLDREIAGAGVGADDVAFGTPASPPAGPQASSPAPPVERRRDAAEPAAETAALPLAFGPQASSPAPPVGGGEDAAEPAAETAAVPLAFGPQASSPAPPVSGGEDAAASAAETAAVPDAPLRESPFDRTNPPFEEAVATGDVEPMLAAHDESPFEEPVEMSATMSALEIEQPVGMHIAAAPLVAEVPAPLPALDDMADVFAPVVAEPAPPDDLTNTLTMAELYERQGLAHEAQHIYESILARDPENTGVRARLEALTPRVNPKIERLERWLAKVSRREVGRV